MDSFTYDRTPGTALDRAIPIPDEVGDGGCVLISSGIPDFFIAPAGLGPFGIREGSRLDVVKLYRPPETPMTACLACGRGDQFTHVWHVQYKPAGIDLVILECACNQANFGLWPDDAPGSSEDADG